MTAAAEAETNTEAQSNVSPGPGAGTKLKKLVERIENLSEEIAGLQDDRKGLFQEASDLGYNKKALRAVIRERSRDEGDREEWQNQLDAIANALGQPDLFH